MSRYDYPDLERKALGTGKQEDIDALGEWFERYGADSWTGECYKIDAEHTLWPVYGPEDEDGNYPITGWELR